MNIQTGDLGDQTIPSTEQDEHTQIQSPIVTGLYEESSDSSRSISEESQAIGQATMPLDIIFNDTFEE